MLFPQRKRVSNIPALKASVHRVCYWDTEGLIDHQQIAYEQAHRVTQKNNAWGKLTKLVFFSTVIKNTTCLTQVKKGQETFAMLLNCAAELMCPALVLSVWPLHFLLFLGRQTLAWVKVMLDSLNALFLGNFQY